MEMEDLTKRLRASREVEKCCLAAICAFGEITEDEKQELWADIDVRAYGGPVS